MGDRFGWLGGGEVDVRVRGRVAGRVGWDKYSAWERWEGPFFNLEIKRSPSAPAPPKTGNKA